MNNNNNENKKMKIFFDIKTISIITNIKKKNVSNHK